jgi:hypothetical protein
VTVERAKLSEVVAAVRLLAAQLTAEWWSAPSNRWRREQMLCRHCNMTYTAHGTRLHPARQLQGACERYRPSWAYDLRLCVLPVHERARIRVASRRAARLAAAEAAEHRRAAGRKLERLR